jgi:YD repeat-containing protein
MFGRITYQRLLFASASALVGLAPGLCFAQSTLSPPREDSNSPTGVSYRNGTLSMSDEDLSIGGGAPTGLSLGRNYNSGVNGVGPGANWTFSIQGYVSVEPVPIYPDFEQPQPGAEPYIYNVVFGGKSVGFTGGSVYNGLTHTGGPVGTYVPTMPSGAQLVFNTANPITGNYTLTDSDGTVVNFNPGPNGRIGNWTMPDGTRLDYTYQPGGFVVKSVISNRGWALLFESATKVCAVNMAQTYVTAASVCPSDAQTVTYGTTNGTFLTGSQLLTSVTRAGKTTTYAYNNKDHLNCVKEPGQSVCKLQTTYTECLNDPQVNGIQGDLHLHDYVTNQQDAGGKTYAYTYANTGGIFPVNCPQWKQETGSDYRPFTSSTATLTENGSATTSLLVDASGLPVGIVNPIGKATQFQLGSVGTYGITDATIRSVTWHEGNFEDYSFIDSRGNLTTKTIYAKPGSGLPNIVTAASYPTTCSNFKTCNKPASTTDAKGKVTDYTYDATHGGLLTESAPADANGIRAVKRYAYVQRYAWIKNAGGGYSHASTPVWLLSEMRTCRTTATVNGACAGGAADEVLTAYEYGPDTGAVGNNLMLRGVAVTADGQTLRTCYGYDRDGNKISETKPRAGLAVCS